MLKYTPMTRHFGIQLCIDDVPPYNGSDATSEGMKFKSFVFFNIAKVVLKIPETVLKHIERCS